MANPSGTAAAFRDGFLAPWQGFLHMRRNPHLWRYGIIPLVLNLLITAFILVLLVMGVIGTVVWLHPWFAEREYGLLWEILAAVVLLVAALGLAVAAWKLLEGVLCGHFYEKLAREVELQLGISPDELRNIPFRYHVIDSLRDTAALVVVNLSLLLVHCIPVVGSLVGICGAFYFNCSLLGRDFLNYPLALRGRRRDEKREFLRRHRARQIGLGAVVLVFQLIPLVGAVVLTTAATGAVLLHRRLLAEGGLTAIERADAPRDDVSPEVAVE